jgi:hypothetical protein
VPGRREARQELLGPLEPEAPVDDREAEQVEPLGGRKRESVVDGFAVQAPYLATAAALEKKARRAGRPAGSERRASAI